MCNRVMNDVFSNHTIVSISFIYSDHNSVGTFAFVYFFDLEKKEKT